MLRNRNVFSKSICILYALMLCSGIYGQSTVDFLGIKLRPEIQSIVKEIERKTNRKIHREFIWQEDYLLASSFISDEGEPVVLIDFSLRNDAKKLEAVIAHELLHLQLRVNNYPTFIFSPIVKTAKGRAADVEQSNVNDLKDLIEHKIFKDELEKFQLYEYLNLENDIERHAKTMKGQADGQSNAVNYARALLEFQNQKDIEKVEKIYQLNNWRRSLQTGKEIAGIINASKLQTPKDIEIVFLRCILKLYPSPNSIYTFTLSDDPENKYFRRMIINVGRKAKKK